MGVLLPFGKTDCYCSAITVSLTSFNVISPFFFAQVEVLGVVAGPLISCKADYTVHPLKCCFSRCLGLVEHLVHGCSSLVERLIHGCGQ
jgi:hypothetical protein